VADGPDELPFAIDKRQGPEIVLGELACGVLLDPYRDQVSYKKDRPDLQFLVVPGFGKIEHRFLIEGKGEVTLKYESRQDGKLAKTIKLE